MPYEQHLKDLWCMKGWLSNFQVFFPHIRSELACRCKETSRFKFSAIFFIRVPKAGQVSSRFGGDISPFLPRLIEIQIARQVLHA
jgi:hypothetical protein